MSCEGCPFNVCNKVLSSNTLHKLAILNGLNDRIICRKIYNLAKSGCDKAEVFRRLSQERGNGKSHFSGTLDGAVIRRCEGSRKSRTDAGLMPQNRRWDTKIK